MYLCVYLNSWCFTKLLLCYAFMYLCIYVFMYLCIYAIHHVCMYVVHVFIDLVICCVMYVCMYVFICLVMRLVVYVFMCVFMQLCVHVCNHLIKYGVKSWCIVSLIYLFMCLRIFYYYWFTCVVSCLCMSLII